MEKPEKQKNNSLRALLRDWLDNGDTALENEMQDTLGENEAPPPEEEDLQEPEREEKPLSAHRVYGAGYKAAAALVCAALIGILLYAVTRMPLFGGADTLMDGEVSSYYVENTLEDTGAVNIVTGIILDYRGFDTLGESHVLFIAVCTVLLMLSIRGERDERRRLAEELYDQHFEPRHDVIL